MSGSTDKCRKRYIYNPQGNYKHTCLIHSPVHSSDKFKVLGDFGFKYAKITPTKDFGHHPANIFFKMGSKIIMLLLSVYLMKYSSKKNQKYVLRREHMKY